MTNWEKDAKFWEKEYKSLQESMQRRIQEQRDVVGSLNELQEAIDKAYQNSLGKLTYGLHCYNYLQKNYPEWMENFKRDKK